MSAPSSPGLASARDDALSLTDPIYRQIRDLIYKVSGIYQPEEKLYLLANACTRRIKLVNVDSSRAYWNLLMASPNRDPEMRALLNEVTIGETCFFRSQPQLEALRKIILPELVKEKSRQILKRIRLWSAGCSTGEEPYTLAMTLLEEADDLAR